MVDGSDYASCLLGLAGLAVERVALTALGVRIVQLVTDDPEAARCPVCRVVSTSGKDWVLTRPHDLPCGGGQVAVQWRKRRWRCRTVACARQSFTEQVAQVPAGMRTTTRLRAALAVAVEDGRDQSEVAAAHGVSWPTVQRAVARRPSVFVRPLSMDEGRKLQKITRSAKNPVRLRRAMVVMMSGQGQTVRDITSLLQVSEDYVRDVIHAFNERGFDALDPKPSGGRPKRIGEQLRSWICTIARTSPADWGLTGFSTWSLAKLRDHLLAEGIVVAISRETLRRILRDGGVSWQTTTTWKASNDPDFIPKMRRVLDLYDHPPDDGRVVCVDEFGPLNLQPRKGKAWRPRRKPRRQRATYTRTSGVMHMLAALDLATGKLFYRIRARKRSTEFLDLLKGLRARWPDEKLYVVCDNFSPHRHARVRDWCATHQVELVFLPTYGSWLNWIEAEFAALRYFALNGTDHRSHTEQNAAIAGYVRWRNARAQPKVNFAVNSSIRTWTDYPVKAA